MNLETAKDTMQTQGYSPVDTATLAAKVRFLSEPSSYPHRPDRVTIKETHMSWVFLAGDKVFKLKKPVRYPYLDFTSLEAREKYCREELRLNRRLAPGIYRDIITLRRSRSGAFSLDKEGEIADWLVEMQRLPADHMLDIRLKKKLIGQEDVNRLAQVLANFYQSAERPAVDPDMPFQQFTREMATNRAVLLRLDLLPDQAGIKDLLDRIEALSRKIREPMRKRVRSGHIVDGHGDLRPEHICLTDPIVIFDCLEFSPSLRLVDPFDELASLGVECAHLDADWFGRDLIAQVAKRMGETIPQDLLTFYTAFRASLRARLSLAHLLDAHPREPQKWAPQTRQYLRLADRALSSHY